MKKEVLIRIRYQVDKGRRMASIESEISHDTNPIAKATGTVKTKTNNWF